jgi:hypothetical protein
MAKSMGSIKRIGFLFFSLGFFFASYSQPLSQKGGLISTYVGVDLEKSLYKTQYPDTAGSDLKYFRLDHLSSSGIWGLKLEQFITRKFGVALDFWYAQTSVSGECIQLVENKPYIDPVTGLTVYPTQKYSENTAYFSKKLSRLNASLRFDLHFGKRKKMDPYLFTALGGAVYNLYFSTTNKDIYTEDTFYAPISFKIGGGIRFFPTRHIGFFTESSLGGPPITFGMTYKFYKKDTTW